jgi:chromosome segregation ATPase
MMQGLMLSKALRIQQDKEDKELTTLQDKVAKHWKSLEEKEAEITSLKEKVNKVEKKNEEAVKVHNADMAKMKKQDDSINELWTSLEAANENIANKDMENQKLLETLRQLWDNSFAVASRCCDILKKIFSSTGDTSRAASHTSGDTKEALSWIEKELGVVQSIIIACSDYCTMIGSRRMVSVLDKAGCDHVKIFREASSAIAIDDIKAPSKNVLNTAKRFSSSYGTKEANN